MTTYSESQRTPLSITTTQDRELLLEDLRAIKVERGWRASQEVICCHWEIGQRIAHDQEYQQAKEDRHAIAYLDSLTLSLEWSSSVLHRSVAFYEKFPHLALDESPDGLAELGHGKALTWRAICQDLLPENPKQNQIAPPSRVAEFSRARIGAVWSKEDHNTLLSLL